MENREIKLPICFGRHWEGTKNSVCITECDPEYQQKCLHVFAMEMLPKTIEILGTESLPRLSVYTGCSPEAILIAMNYKNNWPQRQPIKIARKFDEMEKEDTAKKEKKKKEKTAKISKKIPLPSKEKKNKPSKLQKEIEKYLLPWSTGDSIEIKKNNSAFTLIVGEESYCLLGQVDGEQTRINFDTLTHVAQHISGRKTGVNGARYFKREIEKFKESKTKEE